MVDKNSENKVLSAMKCIHKGRKRADSDTIIQRRKMLVQKISQGY